MDATADPRLDGIGIIFDMDGVLVDSYAAHMQSWQLLGEELGRRVTAEEFAQTFGRTSRDIIRRFFGADRSEGEVRRLDDRKEALYRDLIRGRVPVMAGAAETLKRLRSAGARLAVGSSGPLENVRLVVDALNPIRFDAIVCGADVTRGKPDPQVFLLAAERMGLLPRACVVVEDAPVGIEAACHAGMTAIGLVGSHPAAQLVNASIRIVQLRELTPSVIRNLVGKSGE